MTRPAGPGGDGILCCDVGAARYAFRSADVRHVERAEYMRAERGEHGRIGTLRLGGQHVPVFALGEVLGMPPDDRADRSDGHIAVTGDRHALTGWLVDRIARAPQPAPGDIAALPALVGAQASWWFEGLVSLGDHDAALLIAPHNLMRPAEAVDARDRTPAFARPSHATTAAAPAPVAVLFSSSVLPEGRGSGPFSSGATHCDAPGKMVPTPSPKRFALSGRQVAAIVQPGPAIPLPGAHAHIAGLAWWRRAAVPLIDFRRSVERTAHSRCLIAQCGAGDQRALVALAIDSEVVMCRPGAEHATLPDVECPPFASGVFDVNGEGVALLDLETLLLPAPALALS